MNSDDEYWDRIEAGVPEPSDVEALKRQLSSPAGRREWLLERELEADLREVFKARRSDQGEVKTQVGPVDKVQPDAERLNPKIKPLPESPMPSARGASSPLMRYVGYGFTAASIILVCLVSLQLKWFNPPSKNRNIAKVLYVQGEVRVKRGPIHAALRPGMALREDDHLVNDDRGEVHFEFNDGSSVKVGPGARWHLGNESLNHGRVFQIAAGMVWMDVRPQVHPMIVRTPVGEVRVLGTRFSVEVKQPKMSVDLFEGQVALVKGEQETLLATGGGADLLEANWQMRAARERIIEGQVLATYPDHCVLRVDSEGEGAEEIEVSLPHLNFSKVESRPLDGSVKVFNLKVGQHGVAKLERGPSWVLVRWTPQMGGGDK